MKNNSLKMVYTKDYALAIDEESEIDEGCYIIGNGVGYTQEVVNKVTQTLDDKRVIVNDTTALAKSMFDRTFFSTDYEFKEFHSIIENSNFKGAESIVLDIFNLFKNGEKVSYCGHNSIRIGYYEISLIQVWLTSVRVVKHGKRMVIGKYCEFRKTITEDSTEDCYLNLYILLELIVYRNITSLKQ